MKKILLAAVFCFAGVSLACAGQTSEISLDDGSVIRAEVVSLENGQYTLRSPAMGVFKLDSERVRRIDVAGKDEAFFQPSENKAPAEAGGSFKAKVQEAQTMIMNDPQAMSMVASLATDPSLKELANDPEALQALNSGDVEKLKNNPRFMEIMNNPRMQAIVQRLINKQEKEE